MYTQGNIYTPPSTCPNQQGWARARSTSSRKGSRSFGYHHPPPYGGIDRFAKWKMVGGPDLKHTKANHHVRDKETRRAAGSRAKEKVCMSSLDVCLSICLSLQYRFGYATCCLTWVPYMSCVEAVSI